MLRVYYYRKGVNYLVGCKMGEVRRQTLSKKNSEIFPLETTGANPNKDNLIGLTNQDVGRRGWGWERAGRFKQSVVVRRDYNRQRLN